MGADCKSVGVRLPRFESWTCHQGQRQYRIAKAIDVPARRINETVHGKRAISADTALRLSRALGLSDMFWINMQAHYDAEIAGEHIASELATIERIA